MNLSDERAKPAWYLSRLPKSLGALLFLLLVLIVSGCGDDNSGPTVSATQTADAIFMDDLNKRQAIDATARSADPPLTPVPTAEADACDLLTKEEVNAAIGKPMEPVTMGSGRCIYQGEAEYLMVSVYAGMTEDDAKMLFNSKWLNPNIPSGLQFAENIYRRERVIEGLGDEAFVAKNNERSATVRRAAFVRQGSKMFFVQWLTTVKDKDISQVTEDFARKILPRIK